MVGGMEVEGGEVMEGGREEGDYIPIAIQLPPE